MRFFHKRDEAPVTTIGHQDVSERLNDVARRLEAVTQALEDRIGTIREEGEQDDER